MKNKIKITLISITFIPVILLTSCSILMPRQEVFDGGEILDKEMMDNIKSEIFNSTPSDDVSSLETEIESENVSNSENATVYWTEGGSVWHTDDRCGHLKRAKEILTGTVKEAIEAGKDKVCSSCAK
jgi:hypothetical protein